MTTSSKFCHDISQGALMPRALRLLTNRNVRDGYKNFASARYARAGMKGSV